MVPYENQAYHTYVQNFNHIVKFQANRNHNHKMSYHVLKCSIVIGRFAYGLNRMMWSANKLTASTCSFVIVSYIAASISASRCERALRFSDCF